ncbi:hypothetical protein FACS18949_03590 [Clostridia bacterium]|nr:hypothetical protein FACS18949_03590 [Clostridia bacterium]
MNCFYCKGDMESRVVSHPVDLGDCVVVVKNVPALVCRQCGEVCYTGTVSKQLETIVNAVSDLTEVAIVRYDSVVA